MCRISRPADDHVRLLGRDQELEHPRRLHHERERETALLTRLAAREILARRIGFRRVLRGVRQRRRELYLGVVGTAVLGAARDAGRVLDAVVGDPVAGPVRQRREDTDTILCVLLRARRDREQQRHDSAPSGNDLDAHCGLPSARPSAPAADTNRPAFVVPSRGGRTTTLISSPGFCVPGFQPP